MRKETIRYTDYNGNEREEDFYFHLSKAELMEWEFSKEGGLKNRLEKIIALKNIPEIMANFKEIICKSYGVKSDNGKQFIKNKEVLDEFVQSEAYSNLYMKLISDDEAASAFINDIVPNDGK